MSPRITRERVSGRILRFRLVLFRVRLIDLGVCAAFVLSTLMGFVIMTVLRTVTLLIAFRLLGRLCTRVVTILSGGLIMGFVVFVLFRGLVLFRLRVVVVKWYCWCGRRLLNLLRLCVRGAGRWCELISSGLSYQWCIRRGVAILNCSGWFDVGVLRLLSGLCRMEPCLLLIVVLFMIVLTLRRYGILLLGMYLRLGSGECAMLNLL